MTDATEIRMNVAALKRVDPYIKDILETATHVALYTFNSDTNEWEKTEIEGALFVYSRIGEPYHSILIMNRLNTKNQVEPVTAGLDLQLQEPFLLYKNAKGNIYGIWFYDKDDCIRISDMLNKLAKESDSVNKIAPKSKKTVQKKSNNVDIFSMLSKAQENYNSHKSIPGGGIHQPATPKSPMSNAIGELSGALSSMATQQDVTSKSVMDFFAKAKGTAVQQSSSNNLANEGKPILARLMSHPAAHTVENLEKQHRSVTPTQTPVSGPPQSSTMLQINNQNDKTPGSIKSKIKNKIPPETNPVMNQEYPSPLSSNICNRMICPELPTVQNTNNSGSSFLRIQSPGTINAKNLLNQKKNDSVSGFSDVYESLNNSTNQSIISNNTNTFEALFPSTPSTNICDDIISAKQPVLSTTASAPALMPPVMFAAPSPAITETLNRPLEPLTRNQLLQAFNYLLRNDPEFMNKLHEAYIKSFSEIIS